MSNNVNLLTDLVIGAISIIIKRLKFVGQADKTVLTNGRNDDEYKEICTHKGCGEIGHQKTMKHRADFLQIKINCINS